MTYLFFSNPTSLYNGSPIKPPKPDNEQKSSNLNQLLSGPFGPGKPGPGETKYNYTCCILKHYDKNNTATGSKNAGIILLGHGKDKLIVQAPEKYWDIWDENTVTEAEMAKCRIILPRTDETGEAKKIALAVEMDRRLHPEFYED